MTMSSAKLLMTAGLLGLASVASVSSSALAGADDGGSKAFFDLNTRGSAYMAPSEAQTPPEAQTVPSGDGYRATAGQDYETYRARPSHHGRYRIPVQ